MITNESITLRRAIESDRNALIQYLEIEMIDNTYLLADIYFYGFNNETTDIWIAENMKGRICGVILRYFNTYLCYTMLEDGVIAEMQKFLLSRNPFFVMAKGIVVDALTPGFSGYTRNDKILCALHSKDFLEGITAQITVAKPENALEIAQQFKKIDELKDFYEEESVLAKNIAMRIQSGEGEHYFIRLNGEIIAHGNSAGVSEKTAFVNAIFTLPDYRGNGYASQIVSQISRHLIDSGRTPVLSYDNLDAGRIYRRLGYKDVGILSFLISSTKDKVNI